MPLFRRSAPAKPLDELRRECQQWVEQIRPSVEPTEAFMPTLITDERVFAFADENADDIEQAVEEALQRLRPKSYGFYFNGVAENGDEAVFLQIAHPDGEEQWIAPLTRHADRAPELGPWEPLTATM